MFVAGFRTSVSRILIGPEYESTSVKAPWMVRLLA